MRCLDTFEYFNTDYIWNYCGANYAEFYRGVRDVAYIGSGGFIEDMDFRRWLDYMQDEANFPDLENYNAHKDDPVNTTMVKEMSKVDTSAEVTNEVPVVDNTVAKDGKIMYNFK
jgi:hypothetical protein